MKLLPVFLPVVALHVGLIVLFLAQPGCQTRPTPPAPDGSEPYVQAPVSAPEVSQLPVAQAAPVVTNRQAPMRPVGTGTSSNLPSAFNADLPIESDLGILQPLIEPEPFAPEPMQTYVVVRGDTLSAIAREKGVTVEALRSANSLSNDRILLGQELRIPAPSEASTRNAASTSDAAGDTYVVQRGDNLTKIAQRMGTAVGEIRAANGLRSDRILVGQRLIIPSVGSGQSSAPVRSPRPAATVEGATYVVAPGDTLSGIGARVGVNYRKIMEVNGITDPTRLYVGQELVIPGMKRASIVPSVEPRPTRSIVPPVETRPAPAPVFVEPSRPVEMRPAAIDPAELEARLNEELPISESEVVEPTE